MAVFTVTGGEDPFLHVSLLESERIICESDAMVMMEDALDLKGQLTGGIASSLVRRLTTGESLFQQSIEAVRGPGDCLLAPNLPGSIEVLTVSAVQEYCLADGVFLAAESGVMLKGRMQGVGQALFGGTGGFVILEASGAGQLAVNGLGGLFTLDVVEGKPIKIDNAHVVAWDRKLNYSVGMATAQNRSFLGNLVSSQTTGEGLILNFSGNGKVVVCSRNQKSLLSWIGKALGRK